MIQFEEHFFKLVEITTYIHVYWIFFGNKTENENLRKSDGPRLGGVVLFTFVLLGGFFVRMDFGEILFKQKNIGEDMNLILICL